MRIKRKRNKSKGIPKTTGYFKKIGTGNCNLCLLYIVVLTDFVVLVKVQIFLG